MTDKKDTHDDEDLTLFRKAMKDVHPLDSKHKNRLSTEKAQEKAPSSHARRLRATAQRETINEPIPFFKSDIAPEEMLFFARSGVRDKQLRQLKKGQLAREAVIDLHGHSVQEAHQALQQFFQACRENAWRAVLVIHGKGHAAGPGKEPAILKNFVNAWLQEQPYVLAFCSAIPKDGGAGAVYVLLKRG